MGAGFRGIETAFIARRARKPDLGGAFAIAACRIGMSGTLLQAGAAVARAMDASCANQAELAYHNRHHAAEACLAMSWLCAVALDNGLLSPGQAVAGVVAMLGHDMLHDGTPDSGGVLEERSSLAAAALAAAAGVDAAGIAVIADVILATNPALMPANAARAAGRLPAGPLGASHDLLRVLANEADVCASLMPRLGPGLGRALAVEWALHGRPDLLAAGTHAGRLAFLRSVPALSGPAVALGLQDARAAGIAAYAAAGAALCGAADADEGCAALDRAGPAAAQAAYDAALQASGLTVAPGPAAARD